MSICGVLKADTVQDEDVEMSDGMSEVKKGKKKAVVEGEESRELGGMFTLHYAASSLLISSSQERRGGSRPPKMRCQAGNLLVRTLISLHSIRLINASISRKPTP